MNEIPKYPLAFQTYVKSWQKGISFIFEMVNTFRDLVSFTWHWKEENIKKKHWMLNLFWSRKTIEYFYVVKSFLLGQESEF